MVFWCSKMFIYKSAKVHTFASAYGIVIYLLYLHLLQLYTNPIDYPSLHFTQSLLSSYSILADKASSCGLIESSRIFNTMQNLITKPLINQYQMTTNLTLSSFFFHFPLENTSTSPKNRLFLPLHNILTSSKTFQYLHVFPNFRVKKKKILVVWCSNTFIYNSTDGYIFWSEYRISIYLLFNFMNLKICSWKQDETDEAWILQHQHRGHVKT